jgi:mannosyl-oligosaccharide alpha-1,2-mannosidase
MGGVQEASPNALAAEIGSLSLEFTRLSQLSGDPKYYDAVQRITDIFDEQQAKTKLPGMWAMVVDARDQNFTRYDGFTLGGMSDSLYEYFPKLYLLLGGLSKQPRKLYEESIGIMKRHLFFRPMTKDRRDILVSGNAEYDGDNRLTLDPQGQHLGCFAGGMVGLAARIFDRPDDMAVARKLVDGCIWAYESMPSGIMPETFHLVPCRDQSGCEWNEDEWHTQVLARNQEDAVDPAKSKKEQAQTKIRDLRLPPGFVSYGDRRYSLR